VNIAALDWNLLVVLEALVAERSVTRAAARLGLSQPATSHALGRLREAFGDPLFVRTRTGLVPTPRTEALAAPLAAALEGVRRALADPARFDPRASHRTFTIASSDLATFVLLPPLAEALAREAPGVNLVVRATPNADVERELAAGTLDLALGPFEDAGAALYRQPLFAVRFVTVLRAGHPVLGAERRGARARRLDVETWCALGHVLVAPGGTRGSLLDTQLAALGLARRIALMVPHFLVAPHVVARSDLVWTAPERMARAYEPLLRLEVRPLPVEVTGFEIAQVWHARHQHDAGHAWLRARFAETRRLPPLPPGEGGGRAPATTTKGRSG
jgi:DNA-binding transcriptional LysR family regulator